MTTLTTSKHATELLERERDLAALAALLTDVREEGRGTLVLLAGEAGIGKTELLRRAAELDPGSDVGWGGSRWDRPMDWEPDLEPRADEPGRVG